MKTCLPVSFSFFGGGRKELFFDEAVFTGVVVRIAFIHVFRAGKMDEGGKREPGGGKENDGVESALFP